MKTRHKDTSNEMSDDVYLRALEISDLEQCHRWHNDMALYETLGGTFGKLNE
jgi:hypothetical protein